MASKTANKYLYLFILQGKYGQGWEDLSAYETLATARLDRRLYRDNSPEGTYRIIQRRELATR